ncbi:MAG: Mut7-C ubiquitin/RNAse domain-containing protein [Gammaproteobacteria bacterium]|nr:Mut7-C ubiquitin/RNAse domain-containing protein [Gammaproteobacteria bacterium]MDH3405569.1 Mut7-C ubiquitin/RNAse domain-containing protein [Gammaproteobacteria bacterium]MDH3563465.1 Mut7-C ubiquitin/RNAse domain-containing protein [Gammaproteobacteria bacterium]MDH5487670.1 Mut7-C ubiquitin/RNAse domain-containing protein [Gammaproteobacteria bacterium]
MAQVQLRFYEELNDFLPLQRRKITFSHALMRRTSVKDLIESFGVPHTEVEVILANGQSVDFSYIVQDGDRISVYPVFESLDISPLIRLRDKPLRDPCFVIDSNLGQLARYLRLLGFDVVYRNDFTDREVARIASEDKRIVLTRDRALLQHRIITHGYFVRSIRPREQVQEILTRLDLYNTLRPFTRCLRCNGELEDVDKDMVWHQLEPKTKKYYDRFRRCKTCGQAYWRGSHFNRMEKLCEYFKAPQKTVKKLNVVDS